MALLHPVRQTTGGPNSDSQTFCEYAYPKELLRASYRVGESYQNIIACSSSCVTAFVWYLAQIHYLLCGAYLV